MATVARLRQRRILGWLVDGGLGSRFTKYTLGSVVAFAVANVTFAALYVLGCSTTACAVAGFLAGAVPNWILNRRWAWQQTGPPPARQLVTYVAISVAVLASSSAATGWTNAQVESLPKGDGLRVLVVTGAYVLVQVVQFAVKFLLYEYWVFAEGSTPRAAIARGWRALRPREGGVDSLDHPAATPEIG